MRNKMILTVINSSFYKIWLLYFAFKILITNYSHQNYNEVQFMDDSMADFFLNLEKDGILDNSLIFFMSDHGKILNAYF